MGYSARTFSVIAKLQDLGATPLEIAQVLEEVGENPTEEAIYEALKAINPEVAERFRKEMSLFVWRTDLRKEPFKRERIVKSLIKETGISRSLAEKIAREIEEKIRGSNLSIITSSLIRELALIKLIEYGMEEAYRRYSRLGIPVYDLLVMAKKGRDRLAEKTGTRILVQYAVLYLMPRELVDFLFEGIVQLGGIRNPFVPFAQTYFTRISDVDRWFEGLSRYLLTNEYVDRPSIFVPPFLEEEHLRILFAIKKVWGAILWSTENVEGAVVSEIPVYSFGSVPERKVLDLATINAEKLYFSPDFETRLNDLVSSLERYQEKRKELVKAGNLYVRLENDAILPEREKVRLRDELSVFSLLEA